MENRINTLERSKERTWDLLTCMKYMLQEESFKDVTFVVGDEKTEIKAHQFICIARSDVFKTMLSGSWEEGKDKIIEVPDADKDIFHEFLRYLYTDELELDDNNYLPLLTLADKYNVSSLILSCSEFLEKKINPSDVWIIFDLADTFNLYGLRKSALMFLVRSEECFNSEKILEIKKELLQEITASEDICISEERLYEVVVKWIRAEWQRKGNTDCYTDKKCVAAGVLDNIRFPVMSETFLVHTVSKDGLLSNDEILQYMQMNISDDEETLDDKENFVKKKPRAGVQKVKVPVWKNHHGNRDVKWGENGFLYFKVNNNIWFHGIKIEVPMEQVMHVELSIREENGGVLRSKNISAAFGNNGESDVIFSSLVKLKSNITYEIQIKIFRTKEWKLSQNLAPISEKTFGTTTITFLNQGGGYCPGTESLISHFILSK